MQRESQTYMLIKWAVIASDIVVLNILAAIFLLFTPTGRSLTAANEAVACFVLNVVYILCVSKIGPILYLRKVSTKAIVRRVGWLMLWFIPLSWTAILITCPHVFEWGSAVVFYAALCLCVTGSRLASRRLIKRYRRSGRNSCDVLFVGHGTNMVELYNEMMGDPTTGYRVWGCFDDRKSTEEGNPIPYLGTIEEMIQYMEASPFHFMGRIYCCLPPERSAEIRRIIDYCENHLIRFYCVPNVRNYLRRPMHLNLVGEVPVLYVCGDPTRKALPRF